MSTPNNPAPDYFGHYRHLRMSRDDQGVLLVEMHTNGGPIRFDARGHEQFVDAFYAIGRDRANKVVMLTGIGDWMAEIAFGSFGDVGDADIWSRTGRRCAPPETWPRAICGSPRSRGATPASISSSR